MYAYFLKKNCLIFMLVFLITALFIGPGSSKADYPDRSITVVVPWGAGGMTDSVTRAICPVAEKHLGQSIIVENKSGASGVIGMNYVLKSKPDGYTLTINTSSAYFSVPQHRSVPFNSKEDITDICPIAKFNHGLAVRTDSPWKTYEEVIDYAKNNPGKFIYACAGIGVTQHIVMERIAKKEGIKWTNVPFKSGSEAVTACLGGHTKGVTQGSLEVVPYIRSGDLRLLLSLNDTRWPSVPDVPCMPEKGYDFYGWSFITLLGPKGLPEPIIQKLESAFKKAKKDPSFIKVLEKFGVEVLDMSGKEHGKFWRARYDGWGKLLKDLGLFGK